MMKEQDVFWFLQRRLAAGEGKGPLEEMGAAARECRAPVTRVMYTLGGGARPPTRAPRSSPGVPAPAQSGTPCGGQGWSVTRKGPQDRSQQAAGCWPFPSFLWGELGPSPQGGGQPAFCSTGFESSGGVSRGHTTPLSQMMFFFLKVRCPCQMGIRGPRSCRESRVPMLGWAEAMFQGGKRVREEDGDRPHSARAGIRERVPLSPCHPPGLDPCPDLRHRAHGEPAK